MPNGHPEIRTTLRPPLRVQHRRRVLLAVHFVHHALVVDKQNRDAPDRKAVGQVELVVPRDGVAGVGEEQRPRHRDAVVKAVEEVEEFIAVVGDGDVQLLFP